MRALWSSDQHTLSTSTPTRHILANLDTFHLKEHDLAEIDVIFFGGDFFDRMVERPNTDMYRVEEWATRFFRLCHKHNVKVIMLAGTQSHDRGQPAHLAFNAPEGMSFDYVDTLCIKTYQEFDDLTIMYVPDNMGKMTPKEIWEKALQVLVDANLDMVDMIVFHGAFEFQLHTAARHKAHVLELWESIVRFYIFAGHIHTPVSVGKLRTSGSFDRTRHGEEHPKGGYVINLDKKAGTCEATFWENKNALPYLTMQVEPTVTPEQLISDIHQFIKARKLPRDSHLRIMGGAADVVNPVVSVLSHEYHYLNIKAENEVHKDVELDDKLFDKTIYEGITLTPLNTKEQLYSEVKNILVESDISQEEFYAVLGEFI